MAADAIIFIPGIKGTKLVETNRPDWDTIWSGLQSNFETIRDLELTSARGGRQYDEALRTLIRPGEIEALAYGSFVHDLQAATDRPVYLFNYDWRLSAGENGARLAEFLAYLVEKSAARRNGRTFSRFSFVTHSLGNFVLRAYLRKHGTTRVDRIVFTVPPFLGSLDIVAAAVIGEGVFPGVKSTVRKIIRTMPGAMELLPAYAGASRRRPSGRHSFFRFRDWQGNIRDKDSPVTEKLAAVLRTARRLVSGGLQDLRSLPPAARRRILVIARDGFPTWQSLDVLAHGPDGVENFVDFENACRTGDGDGRVPHVSSCCYFDAVTTLMVGDAVWYREYDHGFVLRDARLQKLVHRFLFGPGPFDWKIPGGSIRRVRGLERRRSEAGLPYWVAQT